jgi:lysophospholipase L1-like esterase
MTTPVYLRRLTAAFLLGALALRAQMPGVAPAPLPVPAAVAITRPTADELAQAKDAFQRFVAQADPATQALLAKYPDLLAVRPPRVNPAVVPFLAPGFRAKHAANVAIAKQGDINVLFMGDSITDFWRNVGAPGKDGKPQENPPMAGKEVFDNYFGGMKVANFGISGDTTQGVLYRLRDGEGQGFQPKAVMLMIGTNNLANCSPAEIAEGVGAVVLELRHDFPQAKILLLGVFPRSPKPTDGPRLGTKAINAIISRIHDGQHVFYLDIGAKFLDPQGVLQPDIMADSLHPTKKGYGIWADAVQKPLADLTQ